MFTVKTNVWIGILLTTLFFLLAACEKEPAVINGPEELNNFIPQGNKKFIYDIEDGDGPTGTATQWISDRQDSAGIAVFNLHTRLEVAGGTMTLNRRIFSKEGKTYQELKVPEA